MGHRPFCRIPFTCLLTDNTADFWPATAWAGPVGKPLTPLTGDCGQLMLNPARDFPALTAAHLCRPRPLPAPPRPAPPICALGTDTSPQGKQNGYWHSERLPYRLYPVPRIGSNIPRWLYRPPVSFDWFGRSDVGIITPRIGRRLFAVPLPSPCREPGRQVPVRPSRRQPTGRRIFAIDPFCELFVIGDRLSCFPALARPLWTLDTRLVKYRCHYRSLDVQTLHR